MQSIKVADLQAEKRWALNGGPFGSKLSSKHYAEHGVPVIRGKNLSGPTKFSFEEFVYVTEEKADELRANNAHPGDLVFTQRGTLGQVGLIPIDSQIKRFVISQSQMKLTVDGSKADPLYLYYYFTSEETVQDMHNMAFSSGVPHINLGLLRDYEVKLPDLPTQRKIAGILSAYDDLIENNLRRIKILEEMAQSLYREWFVHFRFPGYESAKFMDSELGQVPKGWNATTLGEFVDNKSVHLQTGPFGICFAVTGEEDLFGLSKKWRESNLIRHHLVAVPLINYTDFEGDFSNPLGASELTISSIKAMLSPRFVHFDECLSFVSSDCAAKATKDLVDAANDVYEIFHGAPHPDITSTDSKRVTKRKKR